MRKARTWMIPLLFGTILSLRLLLPGVCAWVRDQFFPEQETSQVVEVFSRWLP